MPEQHRPPEITRTMRDLIKNGVDHYSLNSTDTENLICQVLIPHAMSQIIIPNPGSPRVSVDIGNKSAHCDIKFPPPIIGAHIYYDIINASRQDLGIENLHFPFGFGLLARPLIDHLSRLDPWITEALAYYDIHLSSLSAQVKNGKIETHWTN